MKNEEVAKALYELSELLALRDGGFKAIAYQRAARTIEAMPAEVSEVYKKGGKEGLEGIPGVGEGIARKIEEFLRTGKMRKLEKLKKEAGGGLIALFKIPGMGPKRIKKLRDKLGIRNIADLKKALKEHKISKLKGFGEESEKDIFEALGLKMIEGRGPLKFAEKEAGKILSAMKNVGGIIRIEVGGSVRRRKATIRDLDFLASSDNPEKVIDAFTKIKGIKKVFAKGDTKATVILKSGMQADIRVFKPESWGAGLLYFTGNKSYNIEIRKIAIKKGYKLNEYGLFEKKTGKRVAGKTEQEVLGRLGLRWISPEKREI
jgi:DNA polymerase (family 10)